MKKILELKKWVGERAEQIIGWDELEKKIKAGQKIKIKYGADPSKPDLHLGHAVELRVMRKFQDLLDAEVQFLIGDFTGRIGDPSGKSKARQVLDQTEVKANALSYAAAVFRILDSDKTSIWANGTKLPFVKDCQGGWWDEMKLNDFLSLLTLVTHAKLIDRDMFQERIKNGQEIYMHEMMYPILQGYDSVMMESDLTIVGTDQLFNELMGRFFQEKFDQIPQAIITVPLLLGTDGHEKMSKSLGNYIGLEDKPSQMYGKAMSIPDELIVGWAKLATDLDYKLLAKELDQGSNPRDIKARVASDIVRLYYNEDEAEIAATEFNRVFSRNEEPEEMLEIKFLSGQSINLLDCLTDHKLVASKTDGRRMIEQGAVKIDGDKILDVNYSFVPVDKSVLRVGKRRWARFVL
ncbi:MAG: tyrosine--tRNA ligase [Patescibacteria group bacterium]